MCVLDLTNDYGLVSDDWFFSKTCCDPKIDFSSFVSSPNIEDRTKRLEANFDNDRIWENTSNDWFGISEKNPLPERLDRLQIRRCLTNDTCKIKEQLSKHKKEETDVLIWHLLWISDKDEV